MRPDLPTGTVTFLFTDIEGSTRLLHDLGAEAYADALAEHRRVLRGAVAAHGGVAGGTPAASGAAGVARTVPGGWPRRATPSSWPFPRPPVPWLRQHQRWRAFSRGR